MNDEHTHIYYKYKMMRWCAYNRKVMNRKLYIITIIMTIMINELNEK